MKINQVQTQPSELDFSNGNVYLNVTITTESLFPIDHCSLYLDQAPLIEVSTGYGFNIEESYGQVQESIVENFEISQYMGNGNYSFSVWCQNQADDQDETEFTLVGTNSKESDAPQILEIKYDKTNYNTGEDFKVTILYESEAPIYTVDYEQINPINENNYSTINISYCIDCNFHHEDYFDGENHVDYYDGENYDGENNGWDNIENTEKTIELLFYSKECYLGGNYTLIINKIMNYGGKWSDESSGQTITFTIDDSACDRENSYLKPINFIPNKSVIKGEEKFYIVSIINSSSIIESLDFNFILQNDQEQLNYNSQFYIWAYQGEYFESVGVEYRDYHGETQQKCFEEVHVTRSQEEKVNPFEPRGIYRNNYYWLENDQGIEEQEQDKYPINLYLAIDYPPTPNIEIYFDVNKASGKAHNENQSWKDAVIEIVNREVNVINPGKYANKFFEQLDDFDDEKELVNLRCILNVDNEETMAILIDKVTEGEIFVGNDVIFNVVKGELDIPSFFTQEQIDQLVNEKEQYEMYLQENYLKQTCQIHDFNDCNRYGYCQEDYYDGEYYDDSSEQISSEEEDEDQGSSQQLLQAQILMFIVLNILAAL